MYNFNQNSETRIENLPLLPKTPHSIPKLPFQKTVFSPQKRCHYFNFFPQNKFCLIIFNCSFSNRKISIYKQIITRRPLTDLCKSHMFNQFHTENMLSSMRTMTHLFRKISLFHLGIQLFFFVPNHTICNVKKRKFRR